jgi:hypothetical protein
MRPRARSADVCHGLYRSKARADAASKADALDALFRAPSRPAGAATAATRCDGDGERRGNTGARPCCVGQWSVHRGLLVRPATGRRPYAWTHWSRCTATHWSRVHRNRQGVRGDERCLRGRTSPLTSMGSWNRPHKGASAGFCLAARQSGSCGCARGSDARAVRSAPQGARRQRLCAPPALTG